MYFFFLFSLFSFFIFIALSFYIFIVGWCISTDFEVLSVPEVVLCQCSYRDDMLVLESLRGSNSCCIENLVVGISKQWLGTRVYQEAFEDYSKRGNFICCLYFVLILWDHFKLFLDAWWS